MPPEFYGYDNESFPEDDVDGGCRTHCTSEGPGWKPPHEYAPELW